MERDAIIKRYFEKRLERDKRPGTYPFITISRQAGAGGHTLAEHVLREIQRLRFYDVFQNWKLFDRELCEAVAAEPDIDYPIDELLAEGYHSDLTEFFNELFNTQSSQYKVHKRIFELERILASMGKVILVGRGSSFVTRGMPGGIHVRLVAPLEVREQHIMQLLNMNGEEAHHYVTKNDKERAHFIKEFFNKDIDDPALYDQVWDTNTISFPDMADMVVEAIQEKHHAMKKSGMIRRT